MGKDPNRKISERKQKEKSQKVNPLLDDPWSYQP